MSMINSDHTNLNTQANHWLREIPFANKGLYDNLQGICENSITAIKLALDRGYGIKLQVVVTKYHDIIVFSDDSLKRMCGIEKKTESLTKKNLTLYPLLKTGDTIPLLKDVLKLVKGRVPLIIEVKRQPKIKNIGRIIENCFLDYSGNFGILSKDPLLLGWFAQNTPVFARGQLHVDQKSKTKQILLELMGTKLLSGIIHDPAFLVCNQTQLNSRLIRNARKSGKVIMVDNVTTFEEKENLRSICDNIIFDGFLPAI